MVGFGSSLRRAQREGWEKAYLDYETLKLLLSQIEAVYEAADDGNEADDDGENDESDDGVTNMFGLPRRRRRRRRDFRDHLFRSPIEFIPDDEHEDEAGLHRHYRHGAEAFAPRRFTLSYSRESSSSEEEDEEGTGYCGTVLALSTWNSKGSEPAESKSLLQRRNNAVVATVHEDVEPGNGFNQNVINGNKHEHSFLLESTQQSSFWRPPIRHGSNDSGSGANNNGLFHFSHSDVNSLTPPNTYYPRNSFYDADISVTSGVTHSVASQTRPPSNSKKAHRRGRGGRRSAQQKKATKVPKYMRVAHGKARAIAQRFTGLLQAETNKVLLFTQSRLGELANTAGSLRFSPDNNPAHPLQNGGLHPSASSSSDGESTSGGGPGLFPWTDSSDDESGTTAALPSRNNESETSPPQRSRRCSVSDHGSTIAHAQRQLSHFAELRHGTPLFLRHDHILREDMLFLSAVEEADGHTAVAVELVHVLRYICVNLVAVRKLCRKYDRLLMNRMLGGYDRREAVHIAGQSSKTIGLVLDEIYGKSEEGQAHPRFLGAPHKLIGVFDRKIQLLANSRTVKVITSCLTEALSEFEMSRSRENAMTSNGNERLSIDTTSQQMLQSGLQLPSCKPNDDTSTGENPSSASTISLTRLQFAVASVHAIREAAREKQDHFTSYVSRTALSFRGKTLAGEGLDGCSRATLEFLVSFNPDSALLLEAQALLEGLDESSLTEKGVKSVFSSVLKASLPPIQKKMKKRSSQDDLISSGLSFETLEGTGVVPSTKRSKQIHAAVHLGRTSVFLFEMSYFVAHAPAIGFVLSTGSAPAYTAAIIGAPLLSSLAAVASQFVAFSWLASSEESLDHVVLIKVFCTGSAFCGTVGSLVHALGAGSTSVALVVLGRFMLGFSCPDIFHRQTLSMCDDRTVIVESARQLYARVSGTLAGILCGSCADLFLSTYGQINSFHEATRTVGWLLTGLWCIHFCRVLFRFAANAEGKSIASKPMPSTSQRSASRSTDILRVISKEQDSDMGSSSGESDHDLEIEKEAGISATYGSCTMPSCIAFPAKTAIDSSPESGLQVFSSKTNREKKGLCRQLRSFVGRLRKLVSFHVAVPVSVMLMTQSATILEALFASAPLIGYNYFGWRGSRSCSLMAVLLLTVFPVHFMSEYFARKFEERKVTKRALYLVLAGLFTMFNCVSLVSVASRLSNLFSDSVTEQQHVYDWEFGVIQYLVGFTIVYLDITSVKGATLSILSKLAPPQIVQLGAVTTIVTYSGRTGAILQILTVGLSHKVINLDFINSLVVPYFFMVVVASLVVRRNFFYLM